MAGVKQAMAQLTLNYQPMQRTYDVAVAGGGTAGVMAACAAAREGARVIMLEREYALGGTSTLALTVPRMTNHMPQLTGNSSLADELQRAMEQDGFAGDTYFASPEMAKLYLERMCARYGVEVLYGAEVTGVRLAGRRLREVVINTASGMIGYTAGAFVDCTGGARLALACGCETDCGMDGENQPMTLRFSVGGVDVSRVEQTLKEWGYRFGGDHFPMEFYSLWREESFNPFTRLLREGVKEGALTERDGSYVQIYYHPSLGGDVLWFNCPEAGHIRDAVSARSVTEMVLYSRESAMRILTFLKRRFPGFEGSYLQAFSSIPGIRESRRLVGDYVLTEEDIRARRRFDDCVAQTAYPVDIHNEHNLVLIHLEPGEYYEIPYRCLLTREVDNLLVAGRCASATFAAQSSMRIQLVCMALGEAAGIAAAMNPDVRAVNGAQVRQRMQAYGAVFAGR